MSKSGTLPRQGVSVARAASITGIDRRQIIRLIERGEIKGAVKLDPDARTAAWIIPSAEVERIRMEQAA